MAVQGEGCSETTMSPVASTMTTIPIGTKSRFEKEDDLGV